MGTPANIEEILECSSPDLTENISNGKEDFNLKKGYKIFNLDINKIV